MFYSKEDLLINSLSFDCYVSAQNLASQFYVSPKTIYRIVKKINAKSLEYFDEVIILSEKGRGYRLNPFYFDKDYKKLRFSEEGNEDLNILLKILFNHPKKVDFSSLYSSYISKSTKERKIRAIEKKLEQFNLEFHHTYKTVWITGNEVNLRKAIMNIIISINKNNAVGEIAIDYNILDKMFIEKQLSITENMLQETLNYPYDINLISYLFMLIQRYRLGKVKFSEPTKIQKRNQTIVSNIVRKILGNLNGYLKKEISNNEYELLMQHLMSIRVNRKKLNKEDLKIASTITKKYILEYFNIKENESYLYEELYKDLYEHILSMVYRLRYDIDVENNMLNDIKLHYGNSFSNIEKISLRINRDFKFKKSIDEADIAYITLYFEKFKIVSTENKKILLVCSSGIGTSELLKIKLIKKFPHFKVLKTIGKREVKKLYEFIDKKVDLVLTTVKIDDVKSEKITKPVVYINPILSEKDIGLINYALKKGEEYGIIKGNK